MTSPLTFGNTFVAAVQSLVNDIENLRTLQDRITQDGTLLNAYLTSPGARSDLQLVDLQNASSALTQLLFTFDSGTPTQKSYLFKLL